MTNYIKITALAILVFSASGCKKWLDVNTDPATPQTAKAEYLLSPIIFQMANNTANDYRVIFKYTQNMYSQDAIAVSTDWDKHGYAPGNDLGGSIWRMVYVNFGLNLEDMIKDAEANEKWTYAGIGYAVKAWGFQMLTDAHGPVVLDEAFTPQQLQFHYQDQPDVYAKVRFWCQKALECFAKTDGANYTAVLAGPSGDTMYKGNRDLWKKFIYAVLAQQYGHLVNKPQFVTQYADSVIKYTNLSFANDSENPTIQMNGSKSDDANPLSSLFGLYNTTSATAGQYGRISQQIVNSLTGGLRGTPAANPTTSTDPRLSYMLTATSTGVYKGAEPTVGDPGKTIPLIQGAVNTPFPGKYLFGNSSRYPIISYAQLQFGKAEAYFLKGDKANAYAAYILGIRSHFDFINKYGKAGATTPADLSTPQINAYLLTSEVAQNATDLTLADIMGQKYIAQWGWAGMEQWCDLRKWHYRADIFKTFKQLEVSQFYGDNGGPKYAYRLRPRYNSEYIWNRNELAKWGGLDKDYHTRELWFSLPSL